MEDAQLMLGERLTWRHGDISCSAQVMLVEFAEPRYVEVLLTIGGMRVARNMTWSDWAAFKLNPDCENLPPLPPISRVTWLARQIREVIEMGDAWDRWADDGGRVVPDRATLIHFMNMTQDLRRWGIIP
jgi:hypothetical protein